MAANVPVTPEEEAIQNLPNFFSFKSIGHGYCPVTETTKLKSILVDPAELKSVFIQGRHYLVPTYLNVTDNSTGYKFRRVTFENQEFYQRNKCLVYGLSGINLVVNGTSEGRWVNGQGTRARQAHANYFHETHLASVKIENPLHHLNPEFKARLDNLPNSFIGLNNQCFKFHEFFTDYGTHLIVQQSLGGEISYSCKLNGTDFKESWALSFSNRMGGMFEQIVNGRLGGEYSNGGSNTRAEEILEEQFFMHGGRGQPTDPTIKLTPKIYADWKSAIPDNLIELKHGFKLIPFYDILPPNSTRAAALKEATFMFLENRLPSRAEFRRSLTEEIMEDQKNSSGNGDESNWTPVVLLAGGLALVAAGTIAKIMIR